AGEGPSRVCAPTLCTPHVGEQRNAALENPCQVLSISRGKEERPERNIRHILKSLQLDLTAQPLLLLRIGRVDPFAAQFLDLRHARPTPQRLPAQAAQEAV